jgi:hypothetical protein
MYDIMLSSIFLMFQGVLGQGRGRGGDFASRQ